MRTRTVGGCSRFLVLALCLWVWPAQAAVTWIVNTLGSRERVPRISRLVGAITPETAARATVRGILRGRKLVVVPFMLKFFYWQHTLFPGAVQWLVTRTGYRRSKSAAPSDSGDA